MASSIICFNSSNFLFFNFLVKACNRKLISIQTESLSPNCLLIGSNGEPFFTKFLLALDALNYENNRIKFISRSKKIAGIKNIPIMLLSLLILNQAHAVEPRFITEVQVNGEGKDNGVVNEQTPGSTVISASKDSQVIIIRKPYITIVHQDRVDTVLFSPDSEALVAESFSDDIKIYETLTGSLLLTLPLNGYSANSIALSHDGAVLAMGTNTGKVHLWNVKTLRLEKTFSVTKWSIYAIALSPNGRLLASCAADGTVQLWDIKNSKLLESLGRKDVCRMSSMSFSPDSKALVTLSRDGRADMWDVVNDQLIATLPTKADSWGGCSITFCPDANTVAIATPGLVQLWKPQNNNQLRNINVPDSINPWKTLNEREPMSRPIFVGMVVLSPDCRTAASVIKDGTIVLWDVEKRTVEQKLVGSRIPNLAGGGVQTMAFSPDKSLFASGNRNGKVELWKLANRIN